MICVRYFDLTRLDAPVAPPEEVAAHVQSYAHPGSRLRSAAAWRLLRSTLREVSPELPFAPRFLGSGQPVLPGCRISLSHSGNLVCAAVSEFPVGVDVEQIRQRRLEPLAKRCLSGEEYRRFQASPEPAHVFYRHWTAKEAYVKLTGDGLSGFGADVELSEDGTVRSFPAVHRLLHDAAQSSYWLCVVGDGPCQIEEAATLF